MLQPTALPALHAVFPPLADPVDGWLLFDFRGINPIMAAVMGADVIGSRRQYVFIPRDGPPTALIHMIDAETWRHWPSEWKRIIWIRREDLSRHLKALVGGKKVAMEYSPNGNVPYGDYVPAGTLELVRAAGATPVSSGELVTRYCSAWSKEDLASHLRAAKHVAEIARAGVFDYRGNLEAHPRGRGRPLAKVPVRERRQRREEQRRGGPAKPRRRSSTRLLNARFR